MKKSLVLLALVLCISISVFLWGCNSNDVSNDVSTKDVDYEAAVALMNEGKYEEALKAFEALEYYKDIVSYIEKCNTAILDGKYNEALALMGEKKYADAILVLEKLDGYKDSVAKIAECNAAIRDAETGERTPEEKYSDAVTLMNGGKYIEAVEIFDSLNGYSDSNDKIAAVAQLLYNKGEKYWAATSYAKIADVSKDAWQKSMNIWGEITERKTLAAGWNYIVGLKADGTVVATLPEFLGGTASEYYHGQDQVSGWTDIIAVSAGWNHTVGLKADGTVVAVGNDENGKCSKVSTWKDIVAVFASTSGTYGLKMDGTVVITNGSTSYENVVQIAGKYSPKARMYDGKVSGLNWTDIVDLSSGSGTVAVKKDGTVVWTDFTDSEDYRVPDLSSWKDVVDVEHTWYMVIGLTSDGRVLIDVLDKHIEAYDTMINYVESWRNVVSISVETEDIVALTSDGKVLEGKLYLQTSEASSWTDIKLPLD